MSRYASGNSSNVTLAICTTILSKESKLREGTAKTHTMTMSFAERIVPNATTAYEKVMMSLVPEGDDAEKLKIQEFLADHRAKVQELSLQRVEAEQDTDAFLAALRSMKQEIIANNNNVDNDRTESPTSAEIDYDSMLKTLMEEELKQIQSDCPPEQHEKYLEVCEILGVEVTRARRSIKDDDIEVVRDAAKGSQGGGGSQANAAAPKCPITAMDMEDPVKSTQCGHTYSKVGIEQLMRQKGGHCPCPMAGCVNRRVTPDQLERDMQMEMNVNRAKRWQQKAQKKNNQNSDLVDSDGD